MLDPAREKAQAAAADIGGFGIECDVADAQSAAAGLEQASSRHGPARVLVNCAGIGPAKRIVGRDGPTPLQDYERVIRINLVGTFNSIRLFAAMAQALPVPRQAQIRER